MQNTRLVPYRPLLTPPPHDHLVVDEISSSLASRDVTFITYTPRDLSSLKTPTMVPVTHLPDLILLALFRQMKPADQLCARKVCSRWSALVPYAARRRSLNLLLGSETLANYQKQTEADDFYDRKTTKLLVTAADADSKRHIYSKQIFTEWNSLRFDSLNGDIIESIDNTFWALTRLVVVSNGVTTTDFDCLAILLDGYRYQLAELKLYEKNTINDEGFSFFPQSVLLFDVINDLQELKSLSLYMYDLYHPSKMTILGRLEELFYYSCYGTEELFTSMLQKYATNPCSLLRIGYESGDDGEDHLALFASLPGQLRNAFTRLQFAAYSIHDTNTVTANFANLTSLIVKPQTTTTFRILYQHLARLPKLVHLSLEIAFFLMEDDEDDAGIFYILPQIQSVKALEIRPNFSSHNDLAKMKIPWSFPNVEVLDFEFQWASRCNICAVDFDFTQQTVRLGRGCLRLMFRPLKEKCTKLQAIGHSCEATLGSAEEILTEK